MIRVSRDAAALEQLRTGATAVGSDAAIFRVTGPGAVPCLQGLLTNDVDKPGPGVLAYAALLTPKGMIVADLWVLRDEEGFTLLTDLSAREAVRELFRRSMPPRLAQVTDLTGEWRAMLLLGAGSAAALPAAGLGPWPGPGRVAAQRWDGQPVMVAGGTETAWFQSWVVTPAVAAGALLRNLLAAGVVEGEAGDAEAARILAGWPRLGAEISDKTLPQEVRYDEIGGVSYTKGCYTGQETVARIHFRGHPNRELRGLLWDAGPVPEGDEVESAERGEVGTIRSVLSVGARHLGLAVIRREVVPGATVTAGGRPAVVAALPFGPDAVTG